MLSSHQIQKGLVRVNATGHELAGPKLPAIPNLYTHGPTIFHEDLGHVLPFDDLGAGFDNHFVQRVGQAVCGVLCHLRVHT